MYYRGLEVGRDESRLDLSAKRVEVARLRSRVSKQLGCFRGCVNNAHFIPTSSWRGLSFTTGFN